MLATVQRVSSAEIVIDGEIFTSIGDGCLMFVCVEKDDVSQNINNMVNKLLNFRMLDGPKGITSSPLNNSGKPAPGPEFSVPASGCEGINTCNF